MKTPKYKDLRFKTQDLFEEWLQNTATKQILFEDNGQDLMSVWIDQEGEILHADIQATIWDGKFVDAESLKVGDPILLFNNDKIEWDIMNRLVVSEIIEI